MSIAPGDRWKAALLLLLIVAVLGYGISTAMSRMAENRAASGADSTGGASLGSGTQTPSLPAGLGSGGQRMASTNVSQGNAPRVPTAADMEEENGVRGPAGRDPFTPAVGQRIPDNERPGYQAQSGARQKDTSKPTMFGGLPPAIPTAPIAPPEPPAVTLKGVVVGDRPIAVVEVGGQTYYKMQGELLPGGVSIARISESGVILKAKARNVDLRVGHTTPPGSLGTIGPSPSAPPMKRNGPALRAQAMADAAAAPAPAVEIKTVAPIAPPSSPDSTKSAVTSSEEPTTHQTVASTPPAPHPAIHRLSHRSSGHVKPRHRIRRRSARVAPSFSGRRL